MYGSKCFYSVTTFDKFTGFRSVYSGFPTLLSAVKFAANSLYANCIRANVAICSTDYEYAHLLHVYAADMAVA